MTAEMRLDPSTLEAVAAAIDRLGAAALEASRELLAHYADTGDAVTQRAVDTMVEHAADALGAITDSLVQIRDELPATIAAETSKSPQSPTAGRPSAHRARGRDPSR
jgi:hypothetical protein